MGMTARRFEQLRWASRLGKSETREVMAELERLREIEAAALAWLRSEGEDEASRRSQQLAQTLEDNP